jgi:hypothetical protein
MDKQPAALEAESIVALMERELPPPRWMLDDATNDEEFVEALEYKRISLPRQFQAIQFYQLVRQAGKPNGADSLEVLLTDHHRRFWTDQRMLQTISDLAAAGWARLIYPDDDQTEPHFRFRGVACLEPWRLWDPAREGRRVRIRQVGKRPSTSPETQPQ